MGATIYNAYVWPMGRWVIRYYSTIRMTIRILVPVHLLNLVPVLDLVPVPIQQNWYSSTQCSTKYVAELL